MSIASEITRLQNAKADIKTAIEAKGVEIPSNATLDEYSDYIEEIPSGGTDTRWQEIGYNSEPIEIQEGIDYAKQILANWDASIANRVNAFRGDTGLKFFPKVDMSNVTNTGSMFVNCSSLLLFPEEDMSNVTNSNYMFYGCYNLEEIGDMDLSSIGQGGTANNNTMNMFYGCYNLKEVGDVRVPVYVRTSSMFEACSKLKKIGKTNIANSMYCSRMFYGCSSLEEIGEISFSFTAFGSTSNQNIFTNCTSLSNSTLKKILIALQVLTEQGQSYRTLKFIGLSQTQANLCTTFDEWTELANNGWTTGY
jgi:hypothetical protein